MRKVVSDSWLISWLPACFKSATIGPVPKQSKATGLNDYRPVVCIGEMENQLWIGEILATNKELLCFGLTKPTTKGKENPAEA